MARQVVHFLISGPVNVSSHGKRVFVDVVKLRISGCKIILYYLGGPDTIRGVILTGRQAVRGSRRCDMEARGWSDLRKGS